MNKVTQERAREYYEYRKSNIEYSGKEKQLTQEFGRLFHVKQTVQIGKTEKVILICKFLQAW